MRPKFQGIYPQNMAKKYGAVPPLKSILEFPLIPPPFCLAHAGPLAATHGGPGGARAHGVAQARGPHEARWGPQVSTGHEPRGEWLE